jgi:hypothetical protein
MKILSLILFVLISLPSMADDYLLNEMETLRSNLTTDDVNHTDLSLRLADLYFDVSIQEGGDETKRKRSLELYKEVFPKIQKKAHLVTKLHFQMGRLLLKLNRGKKSVPHFKTVFNTESAAAKLKRESAFYLAEWFEQEVIYPQADKYYREALKLCGNKDTCNYAHYRLAWLLYKDLKLDEAITHLKDSLYDAKGQIREKVLKDYILFMSAKSTDGLVELVEAKSLAAKINRPEIVRALAESYFASGNTIAGTRILEDINREDPQTYYQVRLLEYMYGAREWSKVNNYLTALVIKSDSDLPQYKDEREEVHKILKRFIVQLDAEVQMQPKFNKELLVTLDVFLNLYPSDELKTKMQQGWLKAQKDQRKRFDRLEKWIDEAIALNEPAERIIKLRQRRLVHAQKLKESKAIIHESLALAKIVPEVKLQREYNYVAAREHYSLKEYGPALKLFIPLAQTALAEKAITDKWALLSQNLVLDIYNAQKNYDALLAQTQLWLESDSLNKIKTYKKDIAAMALVKQQARFERAASLGESKEALEVFYEYCFNGIYAKKACTNAKVLAVKLQDQTKLVALLEKAKDEKALMTEYELMGQYAKAAKLQEKFNLTKKADTAVYLKIALMYEIDQDYKNRDRILKKLITRAKRQKKFDAQFEKAIFLTLDEAGMINSKALSYPWSLPVKLKLAHRLEVDKPNKKTQKILMGQQTAQGPAWSKLVLAKFQKQNAKQAKIKFYGRYSQYRFKKRTKLLKKLASDVSVYLNGADSETRLYLLHLLHTAYNQLSTEIMMTPLPEGLDEETMMQVSVQLQTMAAPFTEVAMQYDNLMIEEYKTMDKTQGDLIKKNLSVEVKDYTAFFNPENQPVRDISTVDYSEFNKLKQGLALAPSDKKILKQMHAFLDKHELTRMKAYITGRINQEEL